MRKCLDGIEKWKMPLGVIYNILYKLHLIVIALDGYVGDGLNNNLASRTRIVGEIVEDDGFSIIKY